MLFMIYILNSAATHSEQASSTKCPTWGSKAYHFPSWLYSSLCFEEENGAGTVELCLTSYY